MLADAFAVLLPLVDADDVADVSAVYLLVVYANAVASLLLLLLLLCELWWLILSCLMS